jgi:hypothetical protein
VQEGVPALVVQMDHVVVVIKKIILKKRV